MAGLEDFSNFDSLEENVVQEATGGADTVKKEAKKEKKRKMEELFRVSMEEDPTLADRIGVMSESIAVVNTLGFGEGGNIIVDENVKDERALIQTAEIVGYRIQNVGKDAIPYKTEEFSKNADGVFVGQKVDKVLSPGETVDLTRKYMTIFCVRPEVSLTLSNGKVMRSSAKVKPGDLDGELEAHYFAFADPSLKVNADEVKINVGVARKSKNAKSGKKWVVKPEFEATFGYLNNEKPKAERQSRGKGVSTQVIAANYINRLLEESGQI